MVLYREISGDYTPDYVVDNKPYVGILRIPT